MTPSRRSPVLGVPNHTLITILVVISCVELAVMFALPATLTHPWSAVVDASLLVLLSAPILEWVVIRPLRQVVIRERVNSEAVLEAVPDAIVTISADGIILTFNSAAERIFGFPQVEAVGQNVGILMPESIAAGHDQALRGHVPGKSSFVIGVDREVLAQRRDGTTFPLELGVRRVTHGGRTQFVGVARDMTQHRASERHLSQALEVAQQATRSRGEFLANMSHEIRTPMNGLIGTLDLLRETELTQDQEALAGIAGDSADQLMRLLNDILDFSKMDAGKLELEETDMGVSELVSQVLDAEAPRATEREVELIADIDVDLPALVRGDPNRLRQVVMNLVSNAVKFTDQGEVVVRVSSMSSADGSHLLRFEVADTGIGIAPEHCERLFESFTQADTSTTRRFGGSGLGLAICRQLIDLMGGEIGVESRPGEGSTFWFTVQVASSRRSPAADSPAHLPGLRVLVLDSRRSIRVVLTRMLDTWGCLVEAPADPSRAIAVLNSARNRADPFAVVLIGQEITGDDGLLLGERILAAPEHRGLALVLLSPITRRVNAQRASELGFRGYLTKPLRAARLRDLLVELAEKRSERRRSAALVPSAPDLPPSTTREPSPIAGLRVLVAEDNPVNQLVVRRMLESMEVEPFVVSDGLAAVEAVQAQTFDVVLMDCQMPLMDGYEATAAIRALGGYAGTVPILALTANAMSGDQAKCLRAGMDAHLAKPITKKLLLQALRRSAPA